MRTRTMAAARPNAKGLAAAMAVTAIGVLAQSEAHASPPDRAEIAAALDARRVDLSFSRTSLSEVAEFLADITGLNFVLGPGANPDAETSCRLQNVSVKNALDLLTRSAACRYEVRDDFVLILGIEPEGAPTAAPPALDDSAASPALRQLLDTRTLDLNFPDTTLEEVSLFLSEVCGVNVVVDPALLERPVHFRVATARLRNVLEIAGILGGCRVRADGDALVFEAVSGEEGG